MRVLVVTSEWPTPEHPSWGIFVQRQVVALREQGVDVDVLSFRGQTKPWRYGSAFWQMRRLMCANRYEVVHAHFGQAGLIAISQRSVPVVVTFHGSELYGLDMRTLAGRLRSVALKLISQLVANKADQVVAVSNRLGKQLWRRTYHVVPMAIDTKLFKPGPRLDARLALQWPTQKPTVLFVGSPTNPIKRYSLAQEVVRIASLDIGEIDLRVATDLEPGKIPLYMNAADILLVTSSHESGPLVVREALACSLPVVSTDVGEVRERITGIEGCSVCADDRPETIAGELVGILRTGKRLVVSRAVYDLDERVLIRRLIEVYELAIQSR